MNVAIFLGSYRESKFTTMCLVSLTHGCCSQGMVILAMLSCVEFYDKALTLNYLPAPVVTVPVPANGLCLWSCLYLAAAATPREQFIWFNRSRNTQGMPHSPEHLNEETKKVRRWALGLDDGTMPAETRQRIETETPALHQDLDSWWMCSGFFRK